MNRIIFGLAVTASLLAPQIAVAQGQPIVVLEYPTYGGSSAAPGLNADNPFVYDPNHTASHRVQPDETLSHIITAYYAGSGLDLSVVQMAIVKKNRSAFVRGNPNFLYADKLLHLPSLNEMKDLVLGNKAGVETDHRSAPQMKSISSVAEMAAVRQHQTGRLAGITIAAMLSVAATAGVAGAKTLDGAAASQMIVDRLAREGLDGTPAIKAGREFPACDGAVSVEPMFGSWNTVSLACDGASKWRFAIRTKLTTRPQPVPTREFQAGAPLKGPIERAVASRSSGPDITDMVDVVALKHSVRKNAMIGADDLILVPVPARNTMGAFFDPADLVGRRMKSSLTAQKPVLARHLPSRLDGRGGQ